MNRLFKGNHAMINQCQAIYTLVRQNTQVTRQYLTRELALPATTVNRTLDRLIQSGLIAESGMADSTGGRRPNLYQTIGPAYYLLGLDLKDDQSALVLADLHLEVVKSTQLPGANELLAADPAASIAAGCQKLINQSGLPSEKILGLGISRPIPACCDEEQMDMVADLLTETINELAEKLAFPVFHLDTRKADFFAARWREAGLSGHALLELSVGQQIELNLITRDPEDRRSETSGKTGRLIVPSPDKAAGTGTILSQIAAIPALVFRFQKAKEDMGLSWTDFCQGVFAGKRKSSQILLDAAIALAISVVNAALLTGCGLVRLGGQALAELPEYETAILAQLSEISAKAGIQLEALEKTTDANEQAIGAAAFVLDHFLGHPA